MPGKAELGNRSSSDSGPEISCAETPLWDRLECLLLAAASVQGSGSPARVETKARTIIMKKSVESFHSSCGFSVAISVLSFTDLLSSFIDAN